MNNSILEHKAGHNLRNESTSLKKDNDHEAHVGRRQIKVCRYALEGHYLQVQKEGKSSAECPLVGCDILRESRIRGSSDSRTICLCRTVGL